MDSNPGSSSGGGRVLFWLCAIALQRGKKQKDRGDKRHAEYAHEAQIFGEPSGRLAFYGGWLPHSKRNCKRLRLGPGRKKPKLHRTGTLVDCSMP
eukprot:1074628-Amphidinium_carterae.1